VSIRDVHRSYGGSGRLTASTSRSPPARWSRCSGPTAPASRRRFDILLGLSGAGATVDVNQLHIRLRPLVHEVLHLERSPDAHRIVEGRENVAEVLLRSDAGC
jgi:hypothetical protein